MESYQDLTFQRLAHCHRSLCRVMSSEETFGQLWSSKTRASKNWSSVVFQSQKVELKRNIPLQQPYTSLNG
jgi:hypothetical protein